MQVSGDAIEILSGVAAGETLVTDGGQALQEGVAVKLLEASAANPDSTATRSLTAESTATTATSGR